MKYLFKVGSEEESDTQIDTDSEFADDQECSRIPKEIPTIVIDEMPKETKDEAMNSSLEALPKSKEVVPAQYVSQAIEIDAKEGTERSASMSNIPHQQHENVSSPPNPRTEQLKRLLQRTESTEIVSAQKSYLRRQYLLGNNSYAPRKSVSTADLGNRFKSFMDKISETQKKLNPAPQPSPAMQAFLNISNKSTEATSPTVNLSRQSSSNYANDVRELASSRLLADSEEPLLSEKRIAPDKSGSGESSDSSSKSEEGKLITFPSKLDDRKKPSPRKEDSLSFSSTSEYDNVTNIKKEKEPFSPPEEKGTLDSEQSERSNLEKHLERAIGQELGQETNSVALIEAFNPPCLDQSSLPVEALNMEIINTENIKNTSSIVDTAVENESLKLNYPLLYDDDNIEEDFDQLANDALIEFSRSNSATSLHILKEAFVNEEDTEDEAKEAKNSSNSLAQSPQNTNQKNDQSEPQVTLDAKKENELDFTSLEESKLLSSSATNISKPLIKTTPNEPSEVAVFPILNQSDMASPEGEALTTEADLSDWADDNDTFAINPEDFETELHVCQTTSVEDASTSKGTASWSRPTDSSTLPIKSIARIASLESLGDSDSAISLSMSKPPPPAPAKPLPFAEIDTMEFMDISGSESSQEDVPSVSIRYNQLEDCTPTSPSPPPLEGLVWNPASAPPPESPKDTKKGFITSKSKSVDTEPASRVMSPRSSSEPPPIKESTYKSDQGSSENEESSSGSSKTCSPQATYEGYIPRFKDRKTPFVSVRDSIDVRKGSATKPLFTPSREDVLQREKNEASRTSETSDTPTNSLLSTTDSSQETSLETPQRRSQRRNKAKDGDLVREMVMSRISKNGEVKVPRRGSRNTQHSFHSSSSSLFSSDPSLFIDTSTANKPMFSAASPAERDSASLTPATNSNQGKSNISDLTAQVHPSKRASAEIVVPFKERKSEDIQSPSDSSLNKFSFSLHKMMINGNSASKKDEHSLPKNVLPATPLTHPEKFQTEKPFKRELFKSSPQLHFPPPTQPPQIDYCSFQPDNGHTREKTSEFPLLGDQNATLSKSLINNSGSKSSPEQQRVRRLSENETQRETCPKERPQGPHRNEENEKIVKKDPDERLRELLEERRRKDTPEQREVRLRKKDSCLQECLDEYRQKRSSAPIFTQIAATSCCSPVAPDFKDKNDSSPHTRAQLGLGTSRHFHRPSRLELESMQIFSSPNRAVRESTSPSLATKLVTSTPLSNSTSNIPSLSTSSLFTPMVSSPTTKECSSSKPPSSPAKSQGAEGSEKKPVKKSKDRERRRSLIQVVAGEFIFASFPNEILEYFQTLTTNRK